MFRLRHVTLTATALSLGWLGCLGCGGREDPGEPMPEDGGAPDATDAADAAIDPDAGPPPFDECSGDCAETAAEATFGDTREPFDLAYFGLEADGRMRIELYGDAEPGCPTMTSPTPGRTLVVFGLTPPTDRAPQTEADGLAVTLFDFDGTLTSEPLLRADSATVTPRAANLSPVSEAFVAFQLQALFPEGDVSGQAYATHCDSLDAP